MTEKKINYNEIILKNYQKTYPNLAEFSYDTLNDSLVYEGNYIKLNGYGLSRIDPIFFLLNPEDIFLYFKNGFYQESNKNIQIKEYLNQLIITEDEEDIIKKYVSQYITKLNIYARNIQIFDKNLQNESIKNFISDFLEAKKIIEEARKLASDNNYNVYQMINSAYNSEMSSYNQSQSKQMDKQMQLTRTKSNFNGYSEFDKNEEYLNKLNKKENLGISGFTSIILIITSALSAGMYIALKLLN